MRFFIALLFLALNVQAQATERNLKIVDHPRFKYMQGRTQGSPTVKSVPTKSTRPSDRYFVKAQVLTLDTRNPAVCHQYARTLSEERILSSQAASSLCAPDPKNPYVSIAVESKAPHRMGWRYSELSSREQELTRQTRNFMVPAVGMMAVLFALPQSLTGWESFEQEGLGAKWKSNVKAGPVVDHDKWAVNYIGHPYAGAAYYVVARHAGFSQTESLMYSAFMSTFFWEYGIEAFAEKPSLQDLVVTPLLGAALGELFIHGERKVRENDNKVLGSRFLGSTALFLMDPAGGILNAADRLFEKAPFEDAEFHGYASPTSPQGDARIGFNLVLWIKK